MKIGCLIALLFTSFFSPPAVGQQAKLEGHVLNYEKNPVRKVRITAPGGQAAETDSKGHFIITFPLTVLPGQATRVEVPPASGWIVYEPMMGNWVTQSSARNYEPMQVIVISRGSDLPLSPTRLKQVIAKWANERAKLRRQVDQYNKQIAAQRSELEEYAFLKEYSENYGFTLDKFLHAAQQWAQAKNAGDKEEQALKEYLRKNYVRAAQLARESALVADEELGKANNQKAEFSLKVIRRFKLEGNAFYEQSKFREALMAYGEIETRFSTRKLSKEDLIGEWADIKNLIGSAKRELGSKVEGLESQKLLSESVEEYRQALTVYTRAQMPQEWARTQGNMGSSLHRRGERLTGAEGVQLLGQAVEAIRQALTVTTREQQPLQWASAQNTLGLVLSTEGERREGLEGVRLLRESADAYQQVLTVTTREQQPTEWAMAQNNLGVVLTFLGERVGGKEGAEAIGQALEALRAALLIHTREKMPMQWAMTQNNIGNLLQIQGEGLAGKQGVRLLGQAVEAYRLALQVRTREQVPQDWAATQNNLGNALSIQGERVAGEEGVRLLGQAVEALRPILQVRTHEHLPQDWAIAQNNLGVALLAQGARLGGEEGVRLLGQAVEAFRAALQVQTREHLPLGWVQTHNNLARTYLLLGNWPGAAESYENVLTLYPGSKEANRVLSALYHDRLFKFEKAYVLNQQWLERHADDIYTQANFAEEAFTTGRFAECRRQINALLAKPEVPASTRIALRATEIANLLALGEANQVPVRIKTLIEEVSRQPAEFKVEWGFDGTRHFIAQNEKLVPYRVWLNQLLDALASKNRDMILNALQQAGVSFKE
jgi:tetratricopeptide (TPR) repeat protein